MSLLLHWGDRLNWHPVTLLGAAAGLLLTVRLLTAWFWLRRLRRAQIAPDPETEQAEFEKITQECLDPKTHPIPTFVSHLYLLAYIVFAAVTVWAVVATAWWAMPLSILTAIFVHLPFRGTMAGLSQLERLSAITASKH
jgi:hypothetical protein